MSRDFERLLRLADRRGILDSDEVQKLLLASGVSGSDHVQDVAGKAV